MAQVLALTQLEVQIGQPDAETTAGMKPISSDRRASARPTVGQAISGSKDALARKGRWFRGQAEAVR